VLDWAFTVMGLHNVLLVTFPGTWLPSGPTPRRVPGGRPAAACGGVLGRQRRPPAVRPAQGASFLVASSGPPRVGFGGPCPSQSRLRRTRPGLRSACRSRHRPRGPRRTQNNQPPSRTGGVPLRARVAGVRMAATYSE
jgi:hypothetical protein